MRLVKIFRQAVLILALLVMTGCNRQPETSSLLMGGDVMLYRAGVPIFPIGDVSNSPWGDLLTVEMVEQADLFAINLESPFGLTGMTNPAELTDMNLCANDSAVSLLQQAEVSLATIANNHAGDCAGSEPGHTAAILQHAGIHAQGENSEMLYLGAGNQKIAVISINDYAGDYDLVSIMEELKAASSSSDLVLVSVHWGSEYQAGPTPHQQELAQALVDSGADVIWGHHPHVLQRMEWLNSAVDGHAGLVMYSMGNLLSDQRMLPDALRTALVRIEFTDHRITDIMVIPMEMDMTTKQLVLVEDVDGVEWFKKRLDFEGLSTKGLKIGIIELENRN